MLCITQNPCSSKLVVLAFGFAQEVLIIRFARVGFDLCVMATMNVFQSQGVLGQQDQQKTEKELIVHT